MYNAVLSLLFHFGSLLGHEIIYITFFPFVYWNIDSDLGRRLVYLWAITMYLGQGLKVCSQSVLNRGLAPACEHAGAKVYLGRESGGGWGGGGERVPRFIPLFLCFDRTILDFLALTT